MNPDTIYICDGCGAEIEEEPHSDDGYNYFCDECWKMLEVQTEVLENQKRNDREEF